MIDMIQKEEEEDIGHRGVLLYYFCGADPAVDQYSDVRQEASSKTILMTLLRQTVSAYRRSMAGLDEVLDYVLASGRDMLSELGLRSRVAKLLKSFDKVRCAYCLPLLGMLLTLAYFVFEGSSLT